MRCGNLTPVLFPTAKEVWVMGCHDSEAAHKEAESKKQGFLDSQAIRMRCRPLEPENKNKDFFLNKKFEQI